MGQAGGSVRRPVTAKQPLPPVVVTCPDDLLPLVAELVELDARPIFRVLWHAIGEWHLQGLLDEDQAS